MLPLTEAFTSLTHSIFPSPINTTAKSELHQEIAACPYERRQSPRREVEMLLTATRADGAVSRGYSRDLSSGGTAALIWGEFEVGEQIYLTFQLAEGKQSASIPAVVRHQVGFRYGLEFCPRLTGMDDFEPFKPLTFIAERN